MLKEHINEIMIRWSPRERRGSGYDPGVFLETPEQARKLLHHLQGQLDRARRDRNRELAAEIELILERVEGLSRKFFQWERSIARSQEAHDLREIAKLPLRF